MDLIGKQLPSVSTADNGKVLGVENGAWKPVAGGSKTPVIVKFTPATPTTPTIKINPKPPTEGTWDGATWSELVSAFFDGRAFMAFANWVMRITDYRIDADTEGALVELIAQGVQQAGTYIWASLRDDKSVVIETYTLKI